MTYGPTPLLVGSVDFRSVLQCVGIAATSGSCVACEWVNCDAAGRSDMTAGVCNTLKRESANEKLNRPNRERLLTGQ